MTSANRAFEKEWLRCYIEQQNTIQLQSKSEAEGTQTSTPSQKLWTLWATSRAVYYFKPADWHFL
jgi:hypothetical protein